MRCSVSLPAPPPAWLLDPVAGRVGDTLLLCSVGTGVLSDASA